MARHHDRDWIATIDRADRPRRRRPTDLQREVGVSDGGTHGDTSKRCPYLLLERRAPSVDRNGVDRVQVTFEVGAELGAHPGRVVPPSKLDLSEARPERG